MDRFLLKRTSPETDLAGTSRPVRLRQDHASNIGTTTTADINLDELPFDPANRKRISQYTKNPKKQVEIRRIYLTRGPYRPKEGFVYPQKTIGGFERRFKLE